MEGSFGERRGGSLGMGDRLERPESGVEGEMEGHACRATMQLEERRVRVTLLSPPPPSSQLRFGGFDADAMVGLETVIAIVRLNRGCFHLAPPDQARSVLGLFSRSTSREESVEGTPRFGRTPRSHLPSFLKATSSWADEEKPRKAGVMFSSSRHVLDKQASDLLQAFQTAMQSIRHHLKPPRRVVYFEKRLEGRTCFGLLPPDSTLRRRLATLYFHPAYRVASMGLLIACCFFLPDENRLNPSDFARTYGEGVGVNRAFDYVFFFTILVRVLLHSSAFGFFGSEVTAALPLSFLCTTHLPTPTFHPSSFPLPPPTLRHSPSISPPHHHL